jgi:hypothetical protein
MEVTQIAKDVIPLLRAYTNTLASLTTLIKEYTLMAQEIDDLAVEVTETVGVMQSAVALINGISARIQDAVDAALAANPTVDLSALNTLRTELDTKGNELAAAVAANTPVVPTP